MPLSFATILRKSQDFGPRRISSCEIPRSESGATPAIHVHLEPMKRFKPCCGDCGRPGPVYDTQPERCWQWIPVLGFLLFVFYCPRRVNCRDCGVKVESMPWSHGKSPLAIPFMHMLARWARRISWAEVASIFVTSWDSVRRSVEWLVEWGMEHRELSGVESIGVDELHWGKGKKSANFMTLVYQIDEGKRRLLHVASARKEASLRQALDTLEAAHPGFCAGVKVACSDMWKAFLNVIKKKLPNALNVLDKFHIVSHLNKGVDETRRGEQARMAKAAKEQTKRTRFLLLKRGSRVRGKARERLKAALAAMYDTSQAWVFKEGFRKFWEYKSPAWAGAWLDAWVELVRESEIKPMVRVADMLARHRGLLLNYFKAKREYSSAAVEGLNHKARVSLAKSYGHRSPVIMKLALYHALGRLPEPPLTHRFC